MLLLNYSFLVTFKMIITITMVMRREGAVVEEEEHGCIWFIFSTLKIQFVVKVKRTKLEIYTFEMHQKQRHFSALFLLKDFAN